MENLDISRHSPKHGFHLIHLNYLSMTCLPKIKNYLIAITKDIPTSDY